jgi:hypothetical protein
MNITADDTRLVSIDEVAAFGEELSKALAFPETAAMRLSRLHSANECGELGGLPEDFAMSVEQVGALELLAFELDWQADRMKEYVEKIRSESPYIHAVTNHPTR